MVANRTESAPRLLDEIARRARDGCDFTLMVPPERHPDAPDWTADEALELVRRSAKGRPVALVACGADAVATIGELVEQRACDEILLCTPPEHHPHWHRHNLPRRVQALGIPVSRIAPVQAAGFRRQGARVAIVGEGPTPSAEPVRHQAAGRRTGIGPCFGPTHFRHTFDVQPRPPAVSGVP